VAVFAPSSFFYAVRVLEALKILYINESIFNKGVIKSFFKVFRNFISNNEVLKNITVLKFSSKDNLFNGLNKFSL
jgi:hypothetical protein